MTRYEDVPGVRWTHLKAMGRSPKHYQQALREPAEMTTALKQGIAFHHLVLTPDAEPPFVEFTEGARRGKAWDKFDGENAGKVILTSPEMEPVIDWFMAVAGDRCAQELLARHGDREAVWTDGHGRKCRVDASGGGVDAAPRSIVDLKSAVDASRDGFERAIIRHQYHAQAAYYMRITGATEWRWLVVEKSAPFVVQVYRASEEMLAHGAAIVDELERKLKQCEATGLWPGYFDGEVEVALPAWVGGENIEDAGLDWGAAS